MIEEREEPYEVYDFKIASGNIMMLALTGALYIALVFLYEHL